MTTPEQTPDIANETELEAQELTDENLDEVSGGEVLKDLPFLGEAIEPAGKPISPAA